MVSAAGADAQAEKQRTAAAVAANQPIKVQSWCLFCPSQWIPCLCMREAPGEYLSGDTMSAGSVVCHHGTASTTYFLPSMYTDQFSVTAKQVKRQCSCRSKQSLPHIRLMRRLGPSTRMLPGWPGPGRGRACWAGRWTGPPPALLGPAHPKRGHAAPGWGAQGGACPGRAAWLGMSGPSPCKGSGQALSWCALCPSLPLRSSDSTVGRLLSPGPCHAEHCSQL